MLLTVLGLLGAATRTPAAAPTLVKDILTMPSPNGLDPGEFCVVGSTLYFAAYDETHGTELWKTDGSEAGTVLVKDLYPGRTFGSPHDLTVLGGTIYFAATDAEHGEELWKTDGTPEGTVLVADLNPGSADSGIRYVRVMGGHLYFSARDTVHGSELWQSDGTTAGTALVKDLVPGTAGSGPNDLIVAGNTLFFVASDAAHGQELWKSDGTVAGTGLLKDFFPGAEDSFFGPYIAIGSTLYFTAKDPAHGYELWKSDGTPAGTVLVKDLPSTSYGSQPGGFTVLGDTLYFIAQGLSAAGLWKTDGTEAGTFLVSDSADSPAELTVAGGTLFFRAYKPEGGSRLWKSDGTAAGTSVLLEDAFPTDFTVVNGTLYFLNAGLWKSDGTVAGTVRFAPFPSGPSPVFRYQLTAVGDALFFVAADSRGNELWKSDGTEAGTTIVKDISSTNTSSYYEPSGASEVAPARVTIGQTTFFVANDGTHGLELWKTDGTEAGTALVKDIVSGSTGSIPEQLTPLGNTLFFSASDGTFTRELWKTDGTEAGTVRVKEIGAGAAYGASPEDLVVMDGTLYFSARSAATGRELWKSDGTEAGTVLVKNIRQGPYDDSDPASLTVVGHTLYLTANDGTHRPELWKSDGTAAGTSLVKDIAPNIQDWTDIPPDLLTAAGNLLFFRAVDSSGFQLWRTDGTAAGTFPLCPVPSGIFDRRNITALTLARDGVFFAINDPETFPELWKSDGTVEGTVRVRAFEKSDTSIPRLTAVDGTIFFAASEEDHGQELWKSDGTHFGTVLVKDLYPGIADSSPSSLTAVGDRLYFTALDPVHGEELWQSDGTEAGTTLVADLTGDSGGSEPRYFKASGTRLTFLATTEAYGEELYSYEVSHPVVTLTGDSLITRKISATYTDAGATAVDREDGPLTPTIVASTVVSNVPGLYSVTWQATDSNNQVGRATRTVRILDTVAPVVTLIGANPLTFEANVSYTDPGATATDEEDGPLTPTITANTVVSHVPGTYQVTWSATDLSGATGSATRTVTVVDTTPPTVTAASTTLFAGPNGLATLGDQRHLITATDNGTATEDLIIEQTAPADTLLEVATYVVGFNVTDQSGNPANVVAYITVVFPPTPATGTLTELIHTGTPAPGAGTGDIPTGAMLSSFGPPAVSNLRRLAARATLAVGRQKLAAIYQIDGAGLANVPAIQNGAVPGPDGQLQTGLAFKSFLDPVLSPRGSIAFAATVKGAKTSRDQGVWANFSGSLIEVLREGTQVPGLPAGVKLKRVLSFSQHDSYLIALLKLAPAPGLVTVGKNDTALILVAGVDTARLLLRTSPVSGATPGIKTIATLAPAQGSPGQGRWAGEQYTLAKVTYTNGEVQLVKISEYDGITPLLSSTDVAESIDPAAHWKKFGVPAMGCDGYEFTVHATLAPLPGVVNAGNDTALIFNANPANDAWAIYAREGELTPISSDPSGPRYANFLDPIANEAGQVAFVATLKGGDVKGGDVKGANKTALFTGTPDNLRLAARLGTFAPDENGQLNGGTFSKITSYALTSSETTDGNLVLLGEATGSDLPKSKQALWATDSTGQLRRILRTGVALTTNGPIVKSLTLLTATPGSTGTARSYNETASVAVLATFDDKTQALVRIEIP